jgi:hypothetical protein
LTRGRRAETARLAVVVEYNTHPWNFARRELQIGFRPIRS